MILCTDVFPETWSSRRLSRTWNVQITASRIAAVVVVTWLMIICRLLHGISAIFIVLVGGSTLGMFKEND